MSEEEYEYGYEYGDDDEEVEYYAVRPNKSQQKRDMAALFGLAEELSGLSETQLETFELPENIHKAIVQVAGMPPRGARKRQLKFIAGQLHKIDIEPVQEKAGAHHEQKRACRQGASYHRALAGQVDCGRQRGAGRIACRAASGRPAVFKATDAQCPKGSGSGQAAQVLTFAVSLFEGSV